MRSSLPRDPVADWAASGVLPLVGRSDGPPLVPPGRAASLAAELGDRIATLTADTRLPVRVDGAALLGERAALTGAGRRGAVSAGGSCRLLRTADGWAAVSCARPDDPALLGALVGASIAGDPWPSVAAWLLKHPGTELAERAALLGLAAGPVHAGPVHAGPVHAGPAAARVVEELPPRSVAGRLVVDFSALWAGPLCAQLLGLAGARVVTVETPGRPDGARRGHPGFHRLLRAGHRSVVLDPARPEQRRALAALVGAADVVIESSRPRALAGLGLDAAAAVAAGTTWVSITASGRASPRVGFGDDVAAGAGLVARDADGSPLFVGDAIADPLAGLTAAALALTGPADGSGMLHEVSMADVVATTLTDPPPRESAFSTPRAGAFGPASRRPEHTPTTAPTGTNGPRPSPAARRDGTGWVVDTAAGPARVEPPRHRPLPRDARPAEFGAHTAEVLGELGIAAR